MRGAIVGSGLIHLALLAALVSVRHGPSIVIPGPDVVQVRLLAPTPPAVAPPPESPAPAKPAPEVKPVEEKGVKIAPPRKPNPAEPAPRESKPAEPAPREKAAVALPYAAAGPSGLRGQVAVDARDFEFTYYLILVRNKIAENWTPPSGSTPGGTPARAVVHFRIGRGGEITGVQLESGSGIDYFDRTAVRAVVLSDPLPPLPLAYAGGDLGVHFGFEYAGP